MSEHKYTRRGFLSASSAVLSAAALGWPAIGKAATSAASTSADTNSRSATVDGSVTRTADVPGTQRTREAGIVVGSLSPGPINAITDVAGVRVGHSTIVSGEGPLVVGKGPVRTGVTVICPREGLARDEPAFAGSHTHNGNGEMTGLEWIREGGALATPIAITNTHSVGVVRDALIAYELQARTDDDTYWSLPVVGETFDGTLNDINGFYVGPANVHEALGDATGGAVEEGSVGGGTGMICHEFKGGTGTASRQLDVEDGGWTVGALVQSNYGSRESLRVDGAPVGQVLSTDVIPAPGAPSQGQNATTSGRATSGRGSIIAVLSTDAPLLPHQCERLARRVGIGLGRAGGGVSNDSGDIFLAFATGNRNLPRVGSSRYYSPQALCVRMLPAEGMTPLFEAASEATEEAIINALLMAGTVTGVDGVTAYGLSADLVLEALPTARRLSARTENE